MWQGASGPKRCPATETDEGVGNEDVIQRLQVHLNTVFLTSTCVFVGYDYGRSTDNCDFAEVVEIIANDPDFEFPSWYGQGPTKVDLNLDTAMDCQVHCQNNKDCDFFSYEFEDGFHECFLKQTVADGCVQYLLWPFDENDELGWHGVSGPKFCDATATVTVEESQYDAGLAMEVSSGSSTTCECNMSQRETIAWVVAIIALVLFLGALFMYNKVNNQLIDALMHGGGRGGYAQNANLTMNDANTIQTSSTGKAEFAKIELEKGTGGKRLPGELE